MDGPYAGHEPHRANGHMHRVSAQTVDLNEARRFLRRLDPDAAVWHFRTFNEDRSGGGHNYTGTLDDVAHDLERDNLKGRGVYVVINEGGQKADEITRIRALYVDFDPPTTAGIPDTFGVPPTMIVESSPGRHHAHWLIDGDMPVGEFKAMQQALIRQYNSDSSVNDLSRVMRLPGFIHRKGTPFRTRVIHDDGEVPIPYERMCESLAPYMAAPKSSGLASPKRVNDEGDVIVEYGRHDDMIKLAGALAYKAKEKGVSRGAVAAMMFAERERGRWSREFLDDEILRAVDGAFDKFARGEWPSPVPEPIIGVPHGTTHDATPYFVHVSELRVEPPDWLVHHLIECGAFGDAFGESGTAKSLFFIDMGLCVAAGLPFHHHAVKQGPVLYIVGEGQRGFGRRVRGWELRSGVDVRTIPFYVAVRPTRLTDEAEQKWLREQVDAFAREHGQPVLIVIDTLARNFGPGDENSTKDMGAAVYACDLLRLQTGAAVVLPHHSGHGAKDRARGAYALIGGVDFEFAFTRDGDTINVESKKSKDSEPPPPLSFRLDRVALDLHEEDGTPVHSVVLARTAYSAPQKTTAGKGKNQTRALRILCDEYDRRIANVVADGRPPTDALVPVQAWRDLCDADGMSRNRFHEACESLKTLGVVSIAYGNVTLSETSETRPKRTNSDGESVRNVRIPFKGSDVSDTDGIPDRP